MMAKDITVRIRVARRINPLAATMLPGIGGMTRCAMRDDLASLLRYEAANALRSGNHSLFNSLAMVASEYQHGILTDSEKEAE
jgi:hypothetical protein